jgi:flagellar biosynthesis/type III secretory pathway M-ring protein FliF/YscJ
MALEPGLPAERARSLPAFESGARRLEQIVAAPGNIRRLSVGVLVHAPLDAAAMDQIRQLIIATAGLSSDRGDTVAFFNRERFSAPASQDAAGDRATAPRAGNTESAALEGPATVSAMVVAPWLIGALLAVAFATVAWLAGRRSHDSRPASIVQRQELLDRVRRTLAEGKLDATT